MLKEPRPGRVKTRLGKDIGMTSAAWWYWHQTTKLIRRLQDPRWQMMLAVSPDRDGMTSRVWPAHLPRWPQGQGDLGDRMARALAATPGPSVLIGSDIPGIQTGHIAKAFRALGQAPSVIGPAPDGGFWLIGLRHPQRSPAGLFEGVRWSHPETRADTLPTLPQPVLEIETLHDVDQATDLKRGFVT
ncbi:MAG: TIGR04282 family arsenosugar biosynthesis glycosyltransferase [Pseudomonadota bacterium]